MCGCDLYASVTKHSLHLQLVVWEFEYHITTGQLLVHRCKGNKLVCNGGLLVLIQMHLNQLGAIELDADALANNFCGKKPNPPRWNRTQLSRCESVDAFASRDFWLSV